MKKIILLLILIPLFSWAGHDQGGGGNWLAGKLVEDYLHDIKSEPAYQNMVDPLLKKLLKLNPEADGFHSLIQFMQNEEDVIAWYFIPSKLKQLSSGITGLDFPSDQPAVQTSAGEVWIDQDLFHSKDQNTQGRLILHEIVMRSAIDFANGPYLEKSCTIDQSQLVKMVHLTVQFFLDPRTLKLDDRAFSKGLGSLGWSSCPGLPKYPKF